MLSLRLQPLQTMSPTDEDPLNTTHMMDLAILLRCRTSNGPPRSIPMPGKSARMTASEGYHLSQMDDSFEHMPVPLNTPASQTEEEQETGNCPTQRIDSL